MLILIEKRVKGGKRASIAGPILRAFNGDTLATASQNPGLGLERGMLADKSGNKNLPSLIVRQAAARAGPHSTRETVWHEITGGGKDGTTGQPFTGSRSKGRTNSYKLWAGNGARDTQQEPCM